MDSKAVDQQARNAIRADRQTLAQNCAKVAALEAANGQLRQRVEQLELALSRLSAQHDQLINAMR